MIEQKYLDDHNHDFGYISFYIQEAWFHKGWVGRAQSPHSSTPTHQNLREKTQCCVRRKEMDIHYDDLEGQAYWFANKAGSCHDDKGPDIDVNRN